MTRPPKCGVWGWLLLAPVLAGAGEDDIRKVRFWCQQLRVVFQSFQFCHLASIWARTAVAVLGGTGGHVLHRASVSALFVFQPGYSFRETSLEAVTEALLPAASKVSMVAACLVSSVLRRRLYSRIFAVLQSCRSSSTYGNAWVLQGPAFRGTCLCAYLLKPGP